MRFAEIHLTWSNETETSSAGSGLKLAHYLASLKRRELIDGRTALHDALLQSGFGTYCRDITEQLIRPLAREGVESWEAMTGLSEPEV